MTGRPMHPLAAVLKQSVRWDTRTSSRISPENSRSGVKMVAVGVAEDDDVVFTLLFSAGARG